MHHEAHKIHNIGFLRAAVLGANDGLISTSSLIVGVASSGLETPQIITTAIAGLIAGAMSMAAGEYVSVSSQADTENADIEREKKELKEQPKRELEELKNIYIHRGLSENLALAVAKELTEHDALGAHVRDELGIIEIHKANPLEAAIASAITFAVGALLPTLLVFIVAPKNLIISIIIFTLLLLLFMGGVAAKVGGANIVKGAIRVVFWGAIAMTFTAIVGHLFGTTVA